MAQLPTPTISGQFNSSNTSVSGTVTWSTMDNLDDLEQIRVRYVRQPTSRTKRAPTASTVQGLAETTSAGWTSFNDGGTNYGYQYRDDRITSGFSTTSPFSDRTVSFSEGSLTDYYCWGMARLEA